MLEWEQAGTNRCCFLLLSPASLAWLAVSSFDLHMLADLHPEKLHNCVLHHQPPFYNSASPIWNQHTHTTPCTFASHHGQSRLRRRTQAICQSVQPTGPVRTGHFFLLCLLSTRLAHKGNSETISFSTLVPQTACLVSIKLLWLKLVLNPPLV